VCTARAHLRDATVANGCSENAGKCATKCNSARVMRIEVTAALRVTRAGRLVLELPTLVRVHGEKACTRSGRRYRESAN
jgi:hypothetical protein